MLGTHIEPVIGLHHRALVFQRKQHHILLYRVVAAHCKQAIIARVQSSDSYRRVCRLVLIFLTAKRKRNIAVYRLARRIGVVERYLLQAVGQDLVGQVARQRCRLCAERQTKVSAVCLAAHIRNLCLGNEVEEHSTAWHYAVFVIIRIGHIQRHLHLERTALIGNSLILIEVVIIQIVLIPPAPESAATAHTVFHLRSLHRHSGVSLGITPYGYSIAGGVFLLIFGKFNLECRPFILLNLYRCVPRDTADSLDREIAGESALRYREIGVCRSVVVGRYGFLLNVFVIGIAQSDFHFLVGQYRSLYTVILIVDNHRRVYVLPQAVDAAVGIYFHDIAVYLVVIKVIRRPHTHSRTRLVGRRIYIFIITGVVNVPTYQHLAVFVSRVLARFRSFSVRDIFYDSSRNRLSCRSIHHHMAHLAVRQSQRHYMKIGYKINSLGLFQRLSVRVELHEIHTHGQPIHDNAVRVLLVCFLISIPERPHKDILSLYHTAQLIVSLVSHGFRFGRNIQQTHLHREFTDISYAGQIHLARSSRYIRIIHEVGAKGRIRQPFAHITQFGERLPAFPFVQSIVYIVYLLLYGEAVTHKLIAFAGKFAGLRQVAIGVDKRVEPGNCITF